jgi:hypothetical protein
MRDAVTTDGNALPKRDPPDVTRFKAAALEALDEAIADDGDVVQNSRVPRNTRTTTVVRWQEYFEAKTISDTTKPDSKRRAFVRASEKLQDLQIIGVWKDRVWVAGQAGQART